MEKVFDGSFLSLLSALLDTDFIFLGFFLGINGLMMSRERWIKDLEIANVQHNDLIFNFDTILKHLEKL